MPLHHNALALITLDSASLIPCTLHLPEEDTELRMLIQWSLLGGGVQGCAGREVSSKSLDAHIRSCASPYFSYIINMRNIKQFTDQSSFEVCSRLRWWGSIHPFNVCCYLQAHCVHLLHTLRGCTVRSGDTPPTELSLSGCRWCGPLLWFQGSCPIM